ncbi:MAG: TetR/AcrR family transcriptional regulator [Deltaproteobacteria bacterium]|nr:TetR/AcrR family transcriptional regulator [Deltaproteobacteria bacterium]MBW2420791.1 TetR/AcrR family transcriptional regulator [Deltaproteobacteria bacterium]
MVASGANDSALARTRRARTGQRGGAPPPTGRGRRRDAERHAAILEAARELILEVGYTRVTIDAIAKRSGASRTTIYEWWGHRAPLVEEALFANYEEWPLPETGCFEEDLEQLVNELVREMTRPEVMRAFPALTAEFQANPELKASAIAFYGAPMTRRWETVLSRAVERGEIDPSANAEAAMHLVLGALWMMSHNKTLPRKRLTPYLLRAARAVLTSNPEETEK